MLAPDATLPPSQAGLCADCVHARWVESSRGSLFLLCDYSRQDARYPRYPALPVWRCPAHEPAAPGAG